MPTRHSLHPPSLPPSLASTDSAAEWKSRSNRARPLAEPNQQREVGVGAVKRANGMMVVYGFVLQGRGCAIM